MLTVFVNGFTSSLNGKYDPSVAIWDEEGNQVFFQDDQSSSNTDNFVNYIIPKDGDYFISVQHWDVVILDPFDPTSGLGLAGGGNAGNVGIKIYQTTPDVDYFSVELEAGDVIGAAMRDAGGALTLIDPSGQLIGHFAENTSALYPDGSPLPGVSGHYLTGAFVAPTSGTYTIGVTGNTIADYELELSIHRPALEQQASGNVQYVYLDFDGATVDPSVFGGSPGSASLSSLSAFLANWGLNAGDEDAVIDAIIANVQRFLVNDVAALGNNGSFSASGVDGQFNIVLLNSRDHPGYTSDNTTNLSTVYVGGTIGELGISTIGIAEAIDIGNFDTSDEAIVLLDELSAAASNPNSINSLTLDASVSIVDAIGAVIGSLIAHEAGHLLGNFHTNPGNGTFDIADSGGVFLYPLGPDNIFGTADDPAYHFGDDDFDPIEGGAGVQDTLNTIAFGASTGTSAIGFVFDVLADQVTYTGDAADDVVALRNIGSVFRGTANSASSTVAAPAGLGTAVLDFGEGTNVLTAWASITTALTVSAGAGNDDLQGASGNDVIHAFGGNDTIRGGDGSDSLFGQRQNDELFGDGGDDFVYGGPDNDTLHGGDDNDLILGEGGTDILNGDGGDDILVGQDGADTLNGGPGLDKLYGGNDADALNGGGDADLLVGHGGSDILNGDGGDDILAGQDGADTLNGGPGLDRLFGGNDADELNGGDDSDLLVGHGGNDILNGDGGDDILVGQDGADALDGGPGLDKLYGGDDGDTLNGGGENDLLVGHGGNDILNGDDGEDIIAGNSGTDTADGGAGNDRIWGHDDADDLSGGAGDDMLLGGSGGDTLNGDAGADDLIGEAGNDILNGGAGNDELFGGDGQDTLDGGPGNDVMFGEAGNDLFVFADGAGSNDWIIDFVAGAGTDDQLDITDFGFTTFQQVLDAAQDVGTDLNLQLDADDFLNLKDVQEADLHADDFFGIA